MTTTSCSADEALAYLRGVADTLQSVDASQTLSTWLRVVGRSTEGRDVWDAQMAELRLARLRDPRLEERLEVVSESPLIENADVAACLRILRHERDFVARVPESLAGAIVKESAAAVAAWQRAKAAGDDFAIYRPVLDRLIALKREEADALRDGLPGSTSRHDVFLGYNDPGMTTAQFTATLTTLQTELSPFIERAPERPALFANARFPVPALARMALGFAKALGLDLRSGRFDVGTAPFCLRINPKNVRCVVNCVENELERTLLHTAHETGHAFYAFGLASLPRVFQDSASNSIAEASARLWDGIICHLPEFWVKRHAIVVDHFPAMGAVSAAEFAASLNCRGQPSTDDPGFCLRTATLAKIEIALLDGVVNAGELQEVFDQEFAWDRSPRRHTPLLDIHWAANLYGRYPAYSLGSVFAGQFFFTIEREVPDVRNRIAAGDCTPVHDWMKHHVYRHRRRYVPDELMRRATGSAIDPQPWIDLMRERYGRHG